MKRILQQQPAVANGLALRADPHVTSARLPRKNVMGRCVPICRLTCQIAVIEAPCDAPTPRCGSLAVSAREAFSLEPQHATQRAPFAGTMLTLPEFGGCMLQCSAFWICPCRCGPSLPRVGYLHGTRQAVGLAANYGEQSKALCNTSTKLENTTSFFWGCV